MILVGRPVGSNYMNTNSKETTITMQEIKPSNPNPSDPNYRYDYYEDEISLVDLAVVFIRRIRWFYGIVGTVFLLGTLYVTYATWGVQEYRSMFVIGNQQSLAEEKGSEDYIATLQKQSEDFYFPELIKAYQKSGEWGSLAGDKLPIEIEVEPKDGKLYKPHYIIVKSVAPGRDTEKVQKIHRDYLSILERERLKEFQKYETLIYERMKDADKQIDLLEKSRSNTANEKMAAVMEQKFRLQKSLEIMEAPRQASIAESYPVKKKRLQKAGIALAIGIFLGFIGVFVVEFVEKVKEALHKK